jgi:phosphoribosyl-dephospho-CoA transferase
MEEKQQILMAWLSSKFGNNQGELYKFIFDNAVDALVALPDFQEWLALQKAQLEAQSTPEALEAQKLQAAEALKKQDDVIKDLLV